MMSEIEKIGWDKLTSEQKAQREKNAAHWRISFQRCRNERDNATAELAASIARRKELERKNEELTLEIKRLKARVNQLVGKLRSK